MKKFFLFTVLLFTSFSLFASEDEVKSFLEKVYADVACTANGVSSDYEFLVERYCSSSFRWVYDEVRRLEKESGEAILHFGSGAYDLFVQCQDYFESVGFEVSDVERVDSASDAVYCAAVTTRFTCDSYEEKEWSFNRNVYVIAENGEWKISDFKTPGEKSDTEIMLRILLDMVRTEIGSDKERLATGLKEIYDVLASTATSSYAKLKSLDTSALSQKIKNLYEDVQAREDKLGEVVAGVENWVETQECWADTDYEISDVKITGPGKAKACVKAKQIKSDVLKAGETVVDLVLKNGSWVVENFKDYLHETRENSIGTGSSFKERVLDAVNSLME